MGALALARLRHKVPSEMTALDVTLVREDLQELEDGAWFGVNIMQVFMKFINQNFLNVRCFDPFLFDILVKEEKNVGEGDEPSNLRRHTTRLGRYWETHDFLIVPIVDGGHWHLLVVDLRGGKIDYFDSKRFFTRAEEHRRLLSEFFAADFERRAFDGRKKRPVNNFCSNITSWSPNKLDRGFPHQEDDHSCGVWCAHVAFALAAQTSPLVEVDHYAIRKKLFAIVVKLAKLPRIAIPKKDTKACAKARRTWINNGANIQRHRDTKSNVRSSSIKRLIPATKVKKEVVDLTVNWEAPKKNRPWMKQTSRKM